MKMNKKTASILAFTLGAILFLSTAFADTVLGSGYDRLKGSLKSTMGQMEGGLKNYTTEMLVSFKDNGRVISQNSYYTKMDNERHASEDTTTSQYDGKPTTSHHNYTDRNCSIWRNSAEAEKYYVTEFTDEDENPYRGKFNNPFNQNGAAEVERILDAIIGSLKDNVQMEDRADGGKEYTGSLSEVQVPVLVNAITSYWMKKNLKNDGMRREIKDYPEIESDMYIKNVSGRAVETRDGLIESLVGEVVLAGRDKSGVEHELVFSGAFKLSDVGTTVVTKPDFSGERIEVTKFGGRYDRKHIGKYKNDIVIEKDGQYVKIGERVLEITDIVDKKFIGRFYETVKPGFEEQMPQPYNFSFETEARDYSNVFYYTNPEGVKEMGQLHTGGNGKVYLDFNVEIVEKNSVHSHGDSRKIGYLDNQFNRVFD